MDTGDDFDAPDDRPKIGARNALNKTYEPTVNVQGGNVLVDWPGEMVDLGDPGEEPDTASVLPPKRDPGFMDSVLHSLYSGIGNLRVLDMSEAKLVSGTALACEPAHPRHSCCVCLHTGETFVAQRETKRPLLSHSVHDCHACMALDIRG